MQAIVPGVERDEDALAHFARRLVDLPSRHPCRLGLLLAQTGLLLMSSAFCVSIAALNIGAVAMLVGCLLAQAPLHRAIGALPLGAYLAWLALSTLVHQEFVEFGRTAVIPLGLVLAQVALHPLAPGAARLRRAIAGALAASVIAAFALALVQFLLGYGGPRPWRVDAGAPAFSHTSGFFGHHQNFGAVMGMLCILVAGVTAGLTGVWRWLAQAAAAIAVVISGSRASLLGLAAAAGVFVALRGRRFLVVGALATVLVLAGGLAVLRVFHPGRFDRLIGLEDGRWAIWRASVAVAQDHPLFGTGGTRAFREAYREVYPRVVPEIPSEYPQGSTTAHNTALSQAAEHGIPLAVLWLVLLAVAFHGLWRRRTAQPLVFRTGVGLIVMALVYGQFEKVDEEPERTLWTGLGILLALSRQQEHGKDALAGRSGPAVG
jgi:O-antigen ligase